MNSVKPIAMQASLLGLGIMVGYGGVTIDFSGAPIDLAKKGIEGVANYAASIPNVKTAVKVTVTAVKTIGEIVYKTGNLVVNPILNGAGSFIGYLFRVEPNLPPRNTPAGIDPEQILQRITDGRESITRIIRGYSGETVASMATILVGLSQEQIIRALGDLYGGLMDVAEGIRNIADIHRPPRFGAENNRGNRPVNREGNRPPEELILDDPGEEDEKLARGKVDKLLDIPKPPPFITFPSSSKTIRFMPATSTKTTDSKGKEELKPEPAEAPVEEESVENQIENELLNLPVIPVYLSDSDEINNNDTDEIIEGLQDVLDESGRVSEQSGQTLEEFTDAPVEIPNFSPKNFPDIQEHALPKRSTKKQAKIIQAFGIGPLEELSQRISSVDNVNTINDLYAMYLANCNLALDYIISIKGGLPDSVLSAILKYLDLMKNFLEANVKIPKNSKLAPEAFKIIEKIKQIQTSNYYITQSPAMDRWTSKISGYLANSDGNQPNTEARKTLWKAYTLFVWLNSRTIANLFKDLRKK